MQLLGILTQRPLTAWMRVYILRGGIGSAAVGAALFWLVWHWLYDKAGLDHLDLLAALFGAVVGIIGWKRRSA